ncbi:flagellar motor switch protein FliM [Cellulomonas sp. SLBN-39]|uniref:flagellar motor switch protein FliM n=1 Tax=Cellulomonas sp. SLBN-39 TaxID=2768446 RepID=UPI0021049133|nr:flagellar motor switch protein FliM [Cellulomonas sp. SLBN-39]
MTPAPTQPARPVAPTRRRSRSTEPVPYDFRRPLTLSREHARHLEMALQRFARLWGTQLTARLRTPAQATNEDLALMTYDEYVGGLPTPTAVFLCQIDTPRSTAILQLPVATALVWVDYLFGGTGIGDEREERELTEIETTVVREILQHALDDLGYAFAAVLPLKLTLKQVQYNPQFVQAVAASDGVLVGSFALRVGERTDPATLMLPADVVLGALRAADGGPAGDEDEQRALAAARADLERASREVPVEVVVRCEPQIVHPRDVAGLAVGDLLPLHHPASRPLEVVVDGIVLARAAAGSHGSRLACQVVSVEENPA